MRRLLLILVAGALVGAGACDALGDDVAATVEGVEVPIADVTALAVDPAWNPTGAPVDDVTIAGEPARAALSSLVQYALAEAELERRGGEVTEDDRLAVEQQFGQNPQFQSLSAGAREVFLAGTATQVALDRLLREIDPEDPEEQLALYELTPSAREQRCVVALVAPAGSGGAVVEALESGTPAEEVVAAGTGGAQPAFPEVETCLSRAQLSGVPEEVVELVFATPLGEVDLVTTDAATGQVDVVVAAVEDRTLSPTGEEIAAVVAQVAEGGVQAWLPLVLPDADVDIDPRFGQGIEPGTGQVLPPPAPAGAGPGALVPG